MNRHRTLWGRGTTTERIDTDLVAQVIAERERRARNRIANCADERVNGERVL